jgi:hypothetical protein
MLMMIQSSMFDERVVSSAAETAGIAAAVRGVAVAELVAASLLVVSFVRETKPAPVLVRASGVCGAVAAFGSEAEGAAACLGAGAGETGGSGRGFESC